MPIHYVYLAASVICETIAMSALQASAQFTRLWPSLLVIAGFGGAFYFLTLTLKFMPVGITYALASGLGIIAVALAGLLLYGQRLDLAAVIGLALIIAGVVVINVLSETAIH